MKLNKKHIIIVVPIIVILLIVGYSIKNAGTNTRGDTTSTVKNNNKNIASSSTSNATSSKDTPAPTAKLSAPNMDQVKSLMKQLSSEKQVSGSQIYIKNNMHFATITFKEDADGKNATEFATKYANIIKKAYNDNNVNVEIVQKEKTIANIVLK